MREKYHRTFLFLIPFLISSVHCQLSCHRIPTSFCCTSRIRDQCPEQCASVQCGTDFIHSLFSTDGSRRPAPSGAHDGNANIGGTGSVDNLRSAFGSAGDSDPSITSFEKPDQSVPGAATWNSNSGDARIGAQKATTTPAPTGFPTLIPFSSEPWTTGTQTPLAPAASSAVPEIQAPSRIPGPELPVRIPAPTMSPWNPSSRRNAHRHRTTPDPRIIRPPESLVVIGDYDEDEPPSENAVVDSPQPFVTSPPPAQPLFPQQTPPPPASPLISNSGDVFARSRKEISGAPDSEQQSGSAATLRDSSVISSNPSSIPYLVRRFSSRSSSPSFAHSRAHHRLICRLTTPGRLACNRPISRLYKNRYVTPPKSWNRPDVRKTSPLRIRKKNFATTKIHITPFMGELARKRRKLDRFELLSMSIYGD